MFIPVTEDINNLAFHYYLYLSMEKQGTLQYSEPVIQEIRDNITESKGISLYIKREDRIHPLVSGNKWRKLKYNLMEASASGYNTVLTFGGAYSNHIYATAAAARETGLRSVGIIRGEEHFPLNPTLTFATSQGMQLYYMDRNTYRKKKEESVIQALSDRFGAFYLIPEGGTNMLAIKGAEEIVTPEVMAFDHLCLPVGTGGTMAGLVAGMKGHGQVLGFSALRGDFLKKEVSDLLLAYKSDFIPDNWQINTDYHFGGYARVKPDLLEFMDEFFEQHHIQLDPVYTGKMVFGLIDLIKKNAFPPASRILVIHTGGLQGAKSYRK